MASHPWPAVSVLGTVMGTGLPGGPGPGKAGRQAWALRPPGPLPRPGRPDVLDRAGRPRGKAHPQEHRGLSRPCHSDMEGVFFSDGRKFLRFLGGKS